MEFSFASLRQSTKHFGIGISLFAAGVFNTVETTGLLCSVRHARLTDRYGAVSYTHLPAGSGLYMSILYHPQKRLSQSRLLTASAASAVWEAVSSVCGYELDIKWVNDLYFQGKKIGGILTEASSSIETGEIDSVITGIGLNLKEPEGGFPHSSGSDIGALTKDGCSLDAVSYTHLDVYKRQIHQSITPLKQL